MDVAPTALFLVQHGEAKAEQEDPARPLSDRGRQEVTSVAAAARRAGVGVAAIYHSGKLRAQQTAELFAAALAPRAGLQQLTGLAPNDDPADALQALERLEHPAMLVGHLPHLSRLTSLLVTGDPQRDVVVFRMGALVRLGLSADGRWRVEWIVTPEVAG